jgi:hypothetical protein
MFFYIKLYILMTSVFSTPNKPYVTTTFPLVRHDIDPEQGTERMGTAVRRIHGCGYGGW